MATEVATRVLIVIVCYRAVKLTIDCLRTLVSQINDVPGTKVAICENGSSEEAISALTEAIDQNEWHNWVRLFTVHPNRGFSGGNNVVISATMESREIPEFFVLLNTDTLVRPGAIKELVKAAERFPDAGIIGPRLEWPDGTGQVSCFLDFSPLHEFITAASTGPITKLFSRGHGGIPVSDLPHEADWLSFACALIRSDVVRQCGALDESYYLYFDDADYCRTARAHGWKVRYHPTARVVHLRGRSNPLKTLASQKRRRPRYWYESRSRYYAKFLGRSGLWLANMLWVAGRGISAARELLSCKERSACQLEWRDIWINAWSPMAPPSGIEHQ